MIQNVGPFVGTWKVGMTGNPSGYLQPEYQLVIGTGKHGDTKPYLNDDYDVIVGCAVLDAKGKPVDPPAGGPQQPLLMLFANGTLRYVGYDGESPLRLYISVAEAITASGEKTYPAIYGTTTTGDPDQVGVWGAETSPPPSPKSE